MRPSRDDADCSDANRHSLSAKMYSKRGKDFRRRFRELGRDKQAKDLYVYLPVTSSHHSFPTSSSSAKA